MAPDEEPMSPEAAWEAAQDRLRGSLIPSSYANWIHPLSVHRADDKNRLIVCGNMNTVKWSAKRYGAFIVEAIRQESEYDGATFHAFNPNGSTTEVSTR